MESIHINKLKGESHMVVLINMEKYLIKSNTLHDKQMPWCHNVFHMGTSQKYLGINLAKYIQDLYEENFTVL